MWRKIGRVKPEAVGEDEPLVLHPAGAPSHRVGTRLVTGCGVLFTETAKQSTEGPPHHDYDIGRAVHLVDCARSHPHPPAQHRYGHAHGGGDGGAAEA